MSKAYYGDSCYFYRDLKKGNYGSDVYCLQEYLVDQGFFVEEPSGFYELSTEEAVIHWQLSNHIPPYKGGFNYPSRAFYAKQHHLLTTEKIRSKEAQAEIMGTEKRCFQIECMNEDGLLTKQMRCLKKTASYQDRMHLCQETCQIAMSQVCDKSFPAQKAAEFKNCLSQVVKNCIFSCAHTLEND